MTTATATQSLKSLAFEALLDYYVGRGTLARNPDGLSAYEDMFGNRDPIGFLLFGLGVTSQQLRALPRIGVSRLLKARTPELGKLTETFGLHFLCILQAAHEHALTHPTDVGFLAFLEFLRLGALGGLEANLDWWTAMCPPDQPPRLGGVTATIDIAVDRVRTKGLV